MNIFIGAFFGSLFGVITCFFIIALACCIIVYKKSCIKCNCGCECCKKECSTCDGSCCNSCKLKKNICLCKNVNCVCNNGKCNSEKCCKYCQCSKCLVA